MSNSLIKGESKITELGIIGANFSGVTAQDLVCMGNLLCANDLEFFAIEGEKKSWGYEIPKNTETQGVININPDTLSKNSSFL